MPLLRDGGYQEVLALLQRAMTGELSEQGWHDAIASLLRPAYLAAETPWAGSGKGGTEADWIQARGGVAYALDQDGTFLDVGCANGFLMECLPTWSGAHGYQVEPYGLDVVPEFVDLARSRLPQWHDRIWLGNVLTWQPPQTFTYVRTGLEYVLPWRRHELVVRLATTFVMPGGRLILGPMSEPINQPLVQTFLNAHGLIVAGVNEREHLADDRLIYRTYWLDC